MKTPIEVAQIQAEALREAADDYVSEKTAIYREVNPKWHDSRINNWLRERADALVTPPVELPTEPTLGWCNGWLAAFEPRTGDATEVLETQVGRRVASGTFIESWVPAVAVPKAALDELREFITAYPKYSSTVNRFLAAVDEANGDRP